MRKLATVIAILSGPSIAQADVETATWQYAMFLVAEEPCSLSFNPQGIGAWLYGHGVRVPKEDVPMHEDPFLANVAVMMEAPKGLIERMTPEQLARHCDTMRRSAETFGILK